jgi:hypothetical protein
MPCIATYMHDSEHATCCVMGKAWAHKVAACAPNTLLQRLGVYQARLAVHQRTPNNSPCMVHAILLLRTTTFCQSQSQENAHSCALQNNLLADKTKAACGYR